MKICVIGKYPPIEGGVSAQTYWMCHLLARAGHNVSVVTNADETEPEHRIWPLHGDVDRFEADYPGGGSVRVSFTQPRHDEDLYYIPAGQPTLTRLASVALEQVRRHDCELIIGWYLEPYVIVASLVAAWTGRPYLIRHAGSDLQGLAALPELGPAYREAMRRAAGVMSFIAPSEGAGVAAEGVLRLPGLYLPEEFGPHGDVLDIAATAGQLADRGCAAVTRTDPLPPGVPVIGTYGKLGVSKGTVDLVQAVGRARASGTDLVLVLVGGGPGWPTVMKAVQDNGIGDATWTLPMIAPWRIPSLIRACDAMAYLERDFEVAHHRAVPPIEILACERPLLLSRAVLQDVLPGRAPDDPLLAGVEVVDPLDHERLAEAVQAVLLREAGSRTRLDASLRREADVAGWYADTFRAVVETSGVPGRAPVDPSEVERLLEQHCPTVLRIAGDGVRAGLPAACATARNPLFAAYALVEAQLPALAPAEDDDRARREMQFALAEQHALWTRVDVEGLSGVSAFPCAVSRFPEVARATPADLVRLRPVASAWLRVITFEVDALAHLDALRRGTPSGAGAPSAPQAILFHKAPNLTPMVSRIGDAVHAFLRAADGSLTLRDFAHRRGLDGDRLAAFLKVVGELQRHGVVMFRRAAVE